MKIKEIIVMIAIGYCVCNLQIRETEGQVRVLEKNWPIWPSTGLIGEISDVSVDEKRDRVYLAQRPLNASQAPICVFENKSGKYVTMMGIGLFSSPHGIKVSPDGRSLWVTDMGLAIVRQLDAETGTLLKTYGTPGQNGTSLNPIQFSEPTDVAFGRKPNELWISDGNDGYINRLVKMDIHTDTVILSVGGIAAEFAPTFFNQPHSLTTDSDGRVYVADRKNF